MVKNMLEEQLEEFIVPSDIYEVDIEQYTHMAKAYNILVVPTLVAGGQSLSGLPTESDLRSFLLQSVPGLKKSDSETSRKKVLSKMQKIMREQIPLEKQSLTAAQRN
jgi:hypothetical protein